MMATHRRNVKQNSWYYMFHFFVHEHGSLYFRHEYTRSSMNIYW